MAIEAFRKFLNPNANLSARRSSGEYVVGLDNVPKDIQDLIESAYRFSSRGEEQKARELYREGASKSSMEFKIISKDHASERANMGALALSLFVSGHEVQRARIFGRVLLDDIDDKLIPPDYRPAISRLLAFLDENPHW